MSRMRRMLLLGTALTLALSMAPAALAGPSSCDTRVNNTVQKLLECTSGDGARVHQAALQEIADNNAGTRASGTSGYDESVAYVAETMEAAGYDVTIQEFVFDFSAEFTSMELVSPITRTYVDGPEIDAMTATGEGDVTAGVVAVDLVLPPGALANTSTSGCEAADFAGFPAGSIALMQRGSCDFAVKAANAEAAGAVGAIIFNEGQVGRTAVVNGTVASLPIGIPVVGATFAIGEELANLADPVVHLSIDIEEGERSSYNVLAEKAGKNTGNVVMAGAHLDSVVRGPGIQDNGSGSAALLDVAENMANVKTQNTLRFAWWGSEEFGLLGSTHYVNNLSTDELNKIALYLNFDMVGSPNHVFFIYDGDDSDAEGAGPGPEGSAGIEATFEAFYDSRGLPYKGTDFSGRSDYGPFIAVGVPSGGLFTGAEGVKTAEEAALWGGTAGDQYDPCYHLACDTFDNINLFAFDTNVDAIAYATLGYSMSTELINGTKSKGNFKPTNPNAPVTS